MSVAVASWGFIGDYTSFQVCKDSGVELVFVEGWLFRGPSGGGEQWIMVVRRVVGAPATRCAGVELRGELVVVQRASGAQVTRTCGDAGMRLMAASEGRVRGGGSRGSARVERRGSNTRGGLSSPSHLPPAVNIILQLDSHSVGIFDTDTKAILKQPSALFQYH